MANMRETTNQLKELTGRFSLGQKISIGVAALLVTAIIGYAVMSVNTPDYKTLFAGLNPEDAGRITTKLKDQKVAFKVSDDSGTIFVQSDKANELRIQLASEGLPQSSRIGFEIFDQNSFGATEFSEQVKYQRALEGELERTIASIGEVDRVRVHVALPRESFFKDNETKAKASVTLKLKSNRQLPESSVAGIVHLVASSVQGLSPDQISVVDTQGRMLARPGEQNGELKLSASQLELREQMEKNLSNRLMGLLEPVVGPGKVRVSVAADLNFSHNEKVEEKFDPQSAVVRSEQKSDERESKDGKPPISAAGTRANQPQAPATTPDPAADPAAAGAAATAAGPAGPAHAKTSQTTNYEVTHTTTRTVDPAGDIKRLSVSVIVDNVSKPGTNGGKPTSVKRSAEDLAQIKDAVLGAIGIDEKRGDQLVVQNIGFDNGSDDLAAAPPVTFIKRITDDPDTIRTALKYAVPVLLVLLAYFLIARPLIKSVVSRAGRRDTNQSASSAQELPAGSDKMLPGGDSPRTVRELEAELMLSSETGIAGVTKADIIKARLRDKTQKDPEAIAQMVRALLRQNA